MFEHAKWITQSYMVDERPPEGKVMAFRRDYRFQRIPKQCLLHIAAFHSCVLWLNGKRIYNSHIRFWVKHVRYDTIDVAPYLQEGINAFALVLKAPNGSTGYSELARPGFIMEAETEDGICEEQIGSDGSWRACIASWYGHKDLMLSVATVYQEHFNAYKKEPENWQTDEKWLTWDKAFVLGGAGTRPFRRMSERDIPFLTEERIYPGCMWQGQAQRVMRNPNRNLAALFNKEEIQGNFVFCEGDTVFSNSKQNVYVYDFGKTAYIRPGLEILERSGKVRLECYYAMALKDRPTAYMGFGFPCEGFVDSFTPISAPCGWEALSPKGFRFMTVKITGNGYVRFRLAAKAVDYPYGEAYPIETEDTFWKKVWYTAAETLRSATNDCIVDTCCRENVLWTFDALVSGKAAYYTFGETKMWKRCLRLIGEGIEEGNFKTLIPSEDSFMKLIDQNLYWIRSCKEYYDISQDIELIKEMSSAIYELLSLCRRHITEENLFSPPEYVWHWIDWANIDRRPYSLPMNCILLNAADAASELAQITENKELESLSTEIAGRIRNAVVRFYDPEQKLFVCHIEPQGTCPAYNPFGFLPEEKVTPVSIHAILLACANRCGTEEMRASSMKYLAEKMEDAEDPEVHMGPGWMEILLRPMFEYGYGSTAIRYIRKRLGAVLEQGAPTFGETFGGTGPYNSAHGWGSCINSLIAQYQAAFQITIVKNL